jgi:bifunctional oligoribonuclease and PAP phosphatase NrnA
MNRTRLTLVRQAAKAIRNASRIVLACHVSPDADALGSLLGMALGLESLGKEVRAVSPDGVPRLYRFLPGWERVQTAVAGDWDLAIGLDADGADRLGSARDALLRQPVVINVDHHKGKTPYGDIQLVDRTAAATGELVYAVLEELEVAVTPEIAVCLLAAVLTDTGSFRYTNTGAETFRLAAALVEAGAHPSPIYEAVYGSRPFAASRLLGRLLSSLARSDDGRIVWGVLSQHDFRQLGVETDAAEGFVDQVRMVEGGEVAVFFREEADGAVRASLRSRGEVDVARVAEEFGGGGHAAAAGCTVAGPPSEAVRRVLEVIRRHQQEG